MSHGPDGLEQRTAEQVDRFNADFERIFTDEQLADESRDDIESPL